MTRTADLVILSKEGLTELEKANLIAEGSEVPLATTPLAIAVREGAPKPDIGTLETFKQALLDARQVAMPGSTSGLFVRDVGFPKLGIADTVSLKLVPRGLDSTAMLAAGAVNLAIGPASELVNQPGIAFVGAPRRRSSSCRCSPQASPRRHATGTAPPSRPTSSNPTQSFRRSSVPGWRPRNRDAERPNERAPDDAYRHPDTLGRAMGGPQLHPGRRQRNGRRG